MRIEHKTSMEEELAYVKRAVYHAKLSVDDLNLMIGLLAPTENKPALQKSAREALDLVTEICNELEATWAKHGSDSWQYIKDTKFYVVDENFINIPEPSVVQETQQEISG